MDRGAWQATAPGVARVGHDLSNKPPPPPKLITSDPKLCFRLPCVTAKSSKLQEMVDRGT